VRQLKLILPRKSGLCRDEPELKAPFEKPQGWLLPIWMRKLKRSKHLHLIGFDKVEFVKLCRRILDGFLT